MLGCTPFLTRTVVSTRREGFAPVSSTRCVEAWSGRGEFSPSNAANRFKRESFFQKAYRLRAPLGTSFWRLPPC